MQIEWIKLSGFRNFSEAKINFNDKTLVIGANDVGKTNLLYAVRLLMDRTLSEADIEPEETDFHVQLNGAQIEQLKVTIKLKNIKEDAVLSKLKGSVSDEGETFLEYAAELADLSHRLYIGHSEVSLELTESRYYLKHIHFRYIQSSRDLSQYIRTEKKHLLRISKDVRTEKAAQTDQKQEAEIQTTLNKVNEDIGKLSYVSDATSVVNEELKKLSHHHSDYKVNLEAKGVNFSTFIDQLSLGASTQDRKIGLGGDGRNNQILMALWKAKSEREHDLDDEAVIYCVEEPEAHLHPHQQRKLSKYLIEELPGQALVSTHSPQITESFRPDSIVRLYEKEAMTSAASDGCSDCVEDTWENMGYRMSILPAEAFFSDCVFLVEGPSERLFYHALADQLTLDIDYHNISILSVDGIDFTVYVRILDALEIPWVMRTDNDVFKVPRSHPIQWNLAGLNRALRIADETEYEYLTQDEKPDDLTEEWVVVSKILNPKGVYVSKTDLENDLGEVLGDEIKAYSGELTVMAAVKFLQGKKAVRMSGFLAEHEDNLVKLKYDELAQPLYRAVKYVGERRAAPVEE